MLNRITRKRWALIVALILLLSVIAVSAQTTVFTYQGKLADAGSPANGSYDFQLKMFDALNGGVQLGSTVTVSAVQVTNGIFTVNLDFGAGVFPGGDRFLEIAVRPAGGGAFTPLSPRQQVTSTPYALRTLNATTADGLSLACLNCVTSSQIQSVQGSQVTGPIPVASVPAGSGNYIQNTTGQQATSNFNISGDGSAGGTLTGNIVSATTQYNIGASRMLSNAGTNNTFVGINAGQNNAGSSNTFVGTGAGVTNTSGAGNAFFGNAAGLSNTTGGGNAFFGNGAGLLNTTGLNNAFFGAQAGQSDTTGTSNSFFGYQAGFSTTTSGNNSFFGTFAGLFNSTGTNNTFVGMNAGRANTTSSSNAFFGSGAGQANTGAQNSFFGRSAGQANTGGASNSFFGFNAGLANTTGGNNSFFGQNAGAANTTGLHNSFFGDSAGAANTASFNAFFGDSAGLGNTGGAANAFFGRGAGLSNTSGASNSFLGFNAGLSNVTGDHNTMVGVSADLGSGNLTNATAMGANAQVTQSNSLVLGSINGVNGATADTSVGIGTTSPTSARLQVEGGVGVGIYGHGATGVQSVGQGVGSTALEITNGAIKVTGAGVGTNTAIFIHVKTAANACLGSTVTAIDNPNTNGDPSAILFVTPRLIAGVGAYPTSGAVLSYYSAANAPQLCPQLRDRWTIDTACCSIPDGAQFAILVIKP